MTLIVGEAGNNLITAGIILFVVGLIQGVAIPKLSNPRMGLAAHLTAVQCGMALMIFGIVWELVDVPEFVSGIAVWSLITGFWLIWTGITIASVTGASKALPIAGSGHAGSKGAERLVTMIELGGVMLSLLGGGLLLAGILSS